MQTRIFFWIIALCIMLTLNSCTHYYYTANQHNVPLFKEKNEMRLSGAYLNGNEENGCEVQAGYAITKEAAIIANALVVNPNARLQNNTPGASLGEIGKGSGQLYELGAGYYKPIPIRCAAISKKFVYETYGVLGLGNARNVYGNNTSYYVNANLLKAYVQPSIGFTTNLFDIIVSAKAGVLHTFGIRQNYPGAVSDTLVQHGSGILTDIGILNQNRTSLLFEPAVTFRIGFKYVKFHFQWGTSFLNTNMRTLTSSPVWEAGLTFAIARRFWQKDERERKQRWKEIWD